MCGEIYSASPCRMRLPIPHPNAVSWKYSGCVCDIGDACIIRKARWMGCIWNGHLRVACNNQQQINRQKKVILVQYLSSAF